MPNWSYNSVAIRGDESAIHKLIKIGLENSHLESTGDILKDFDLLVEKAVTKTFVEGDLRTPREIEEYNKLTAYTFTPVPDTFLVYDTTNYPDVFKDAAAEQKEKYGVVGWYDYNCKTLGTKWNFELDNVNLGTNDKGDYLLEFDCQTAWDTPDGWLVNIGKLVEGLTVMIMAYEESGAYYMCAYVSDDVVVLYDNLTEKVNRDGEKWYEERNNYIEKLKKEKSLSEDDIYEMADEKYGGRFDDNPYIEELDEIFCKMRDDYSID